MLWQNKELKEHRSLTNLFAFLKLVKDNRLSLVKVVFIVLAKGFALLLEILAKVYPLDVQCGLVVLLHEGRVQANMNCRRA